MPQVNKNGKRFFVSDFNPAFWRSLEAGTWEGWTFRIFDKFTDQDHACLDVGAWIGPLTLYGAHCAKHCYSFEPDPVAFKRLKENVDLNPRLKKKITLFNGCLADKNGSIGLSNLNEFGDTMSSMTLTGKRKTVKVKASTLDKFMKKHGVKDCNFIKMDIEGGEARVLANIKDYLAEEKPTLHLSLHSYWFQGREKDCLNVIEALKPYKHIFNHKGHPLPLKRLLKGVLLKMRPYDIVATDRAWT
jgi:FkbM family methyltransferase